jgi:hypothetical protein
MRSYLSYDNVVWELLISETQLVDIMNANTIHFSYYNFAVSMTDYSHCLGFRLFNISSTSE